MPSEQLPSLSQLALKAQKIEKKKPPPRDDSSDEEEEHTPEPLPVSTRALPAPPTTQKGGGGDMKVS